MKPNDLQFASLEAFTPSLGALRIGRLIGTTLRGEPVIDYPGNEAGPLVAKVLASASLPAQATEGEGTPVALGFEADDPRRPVIFGFIATRLPLAEAPAAVAASERDGSTLDLIARERITLQCGRSSITLFADGRVIVKGTRLLSRASESNKIKGATVALN